MNGAGAVWVLAGKGLWAHRGRLTLSVLAVVLGVAFIAGTLLLTDSLTAGIGNLAPRRATATVRAPSTLEGEARPGAAGRPAGAAAPPGGGPGRGRQGPRWGAARARDRQRQGPVAGAVVARGRLAVPP